MRQKGHSVIAVFRIVLWAGLLTVTNFTLAQVKAGPDARPQEALTLEQQGKNLQAEAAWRVYLKAHPSSAEPYAHLGLLEARQEHYKEAVPLYRKALQLGPDVPGLRLNLGLALFKSGDLKGAILEFGPLLRANPGNRQLTTLMGMAHFGLAQYPEAVPFLKEAAAQDTKNLQLRLALAQSCLWSKQNQCVLDTYREILNLDPDSAEADLLAGEALDAMKDNAGSTKMFRAALKADPKLPNAHFGLGYLLWTQKAYEEAASEFHAELANDIQLNQMEDAKSLLEGVEKQDPATFLVHLDLGVVYVEAGRPNDALRELLAAEKLKPNDVNIHWRLARVYRLLGKADNAKAEFDMAGQLTKAADDDNFKKISDAGKKQGPPPSQSPPPDK
jgi:tetratricopeptide (TPR) repeat protein